MHLTQEYYDRNIMHYVDQEIKIDCNPAHQTARQTSVYSQFNVLSTSATRSFENVSKPNNHSICICRHNIIHIPICLV